MQRAEMRIANRREQMGQVATMVEEFGARCAIPGSIVNDLNVVLDEMLINTISYGYPEGQQAEIVVRLSFDAGRVEAEIEDDASAFNPLEAAPSGLGLSLRERKVGGVGILFVRNLMDEVAYSRV